MSDAFERVRAEAQRYMETYHTAGELLSVSVREAMPWAMQYALNQRVPDVRNLETLCARLLAIVASSEPSNRTEE